MKESKFVKTKILLGYALIVVLGAVSMYYLYRQMEDFSEPDTAHASLRLKRDVVNQTLYRLYRAESFGQLMIAGNNAYERPYRDEVAHVHLLIDSLRNMSDGQDSSQLRRLDSISLLLYDKERRTMSLRRHLREAGLDDLIDRNIREMIATQPDSVVRRDTISAIVYDTIRTPKPRRNFFRRFADLFSPPKVDSSVTISTRVVVDTMQISVPDTIATVLQTLRDRVADDRLRIFREAWREGLQLRDGNRIVGQKIYQLIMDYEEQGTAGAMREIERRNALRHRSATVLGGVALAALLLTFFFVTILWRDINRSIRYKRELERLNRDNRALLAAREQLMLAITHDIKAPLGAIIGHIDLLERLRPARREALYLQQMRRASGHLLGLVNSLLDFCRLETAKVEVVRVAFDPQRLFEEICDGFRPAAEQRGLTLELRCTGRSEEVAGDAFRIRQIADNLISNALKFTERGGIIVRFETSGERLIFSVEDSGRGIAPEEQERIFKEFTRLESAQGIEGFGLGLSIVDRLVRLLGGTISVDSTPGRGSRFTVSLPAEAAPAEPAPAAPELPAGIRCLFVDDDALQLDMNLRLCREAGIDAEGCPHPEAVAELLAGNRFDLLFTDIQMPGMDGFRLLERIRGSEAGAQIPVVAVTARADADERHYVDKGFAAVLRKPFTLGDLQRTLRRLLPTCPAAENTPEEAVPPTGFAALTAYAGEDRAAARQILESFALQTRESCRTLCEAADKADGETIRSTAHKMLPLFTLIGAAEVAASLRRLEGLREKPTAALLDETRTTAARAATFAENAEKELSLLQE